MSFNKDPMIMRSIIMDHYENPHFFNDSTSNSIPGYYSYNIQSPSCIDNITANIKFKNETIDEIKLNGIGCAIATSSSDILSQLIINKSKQDAVKIINNYLAMIDGQKYDEQMLDDLYVFENVNKQLNRVKCAKVGASALLGAIEQKK